MLTTILYLKSIRYSSSPLLSRAVLHSVCPLSSSQLLQVVFSWELAQGGHWKMTLSLALCGEHMAISLHSFCDEGSISKHENILDCIGFAWPVLFSPYHTLIWWVINHINLPKAESCPWWWLVRDLSLPLSWPRTLPSYFLSPPSSWVTEQLGWAPDICPLSIHHTDWHR